MTQSPIVKYGLAGIFAIGSLWVYDVGSTAAKEMVSLPLVEEIKTQTKENTRPIPANLQTLYLVQIEDGDFPTIGSSRNESEQQPALTQKESSSVFANANLAGNEAVTQKRVAPRIAAITESGVILSGYGFVRAGESVLIQGQGWKLNGSFEKGYTFSSI